MWDKIAPKQKHLMLNIYKLKNKQNLSKHYRKGNEIAQTRHYPPANKEWFNSIYAYNKNTIKLLPVADKVTLRLLKSYFNLYSFKLERSVKSSRVRRRLRRLSTNRILISKPELKHTSSKVVITVYVYNRQKIYYLRKWDNILKYPYYELYFKELKMILGKGKIYKNYLKKVLRLKPKRVERTIRSLRPMVQLKKKISLNLISKVYKQKKKLVKTLKIKHNKYKNYENKYLKSFFSKCLQRDMILFYYKQIISLNESKFEKTYLLPLTGLIQNIYSKKVEFNLVNLKNLYLNSYIFSETLATKIRNKKNRVLRVLKASLNMFQLASLNNLAIFDDMYNRKKRLQNLKVNYLDLGKNIKGDEINEVTQKEKVYRKKSLSTIEDNITQTISTTNSVLDSIKNKSITGIRIEATGRLTRRNTAEKSISKLRYKGNLRNMDSSYKRFSSVLLRGHVKSNVQYTKLRSKLRIGSFGLKGWVSSN